MADPSSRVLYPGPHAKIEPLGCGETVSRAALRAQQPEPAGWTTARTAARTAARTQPLAGRTPGLVQVRGRRAILKWAEPLRELAWRSGQTGECDNLAYFLDTPDAHRKTPWLLYDPGAGGGLRAAVLLFEYRAGPLGSRVYVTADSTGRRNVLAAPNLRETVAAAAARQLLDGGAAMVHIVFSRSHRDAEPQAALEGRPGGRAAPAGPSGGVLGEVTRQALTAGAAGHGRWALSEQEIRAYLALAGTFDQTLARIGQKTRANLRYYRRRAEAELGCRFVAEARMGRTEFIAFDRRCRYPVGDARAGWRWDALRRMRGGFLCGVCSGQGEWLAVAGGRQQNGVAELDWQMNRADLPASSLSTVLRSYLIEHLVQRGMRRMYIEGGTPQPLGLSFAAERVAELTVTRLSGYARLVERLLPVAAPRNYLAQVLARPGLGWHYW